MDINKLTIRSQEALAAAQKLAGELNHQQVESPHLLRALLGEPEGVVYPLLQKLGAQPQSLRAASTRFSRARPRSTDRSRSTSARA